MDCIQKTNPFCFIQYQTPVMLLHWINAELVQRSHHLDVDVQQLHFLCTLGVQGKMRCAFAITLLALKILILQRAFQVQKVNVWMCSHLHRHTRSLKEERSLGAHHSVPSHCESFAI